MRYGNLRFVAVAVAVGLLLQAGARASLHTVSFVRITNNNVENVADQLQLDILDQAMALSGYGVAIDADELLFVFKNNGPIQSAISEIYIDDGTVVGQSTLFNDLVGSTDFTGMGANPGNLPAGNTLDPDFIATDGFSADAQGNPSKGVNPNEALGIAYEVNDGFSGVVDALADGTLRVGMHLRSIGVAEDSDSFVNMDMVPEPTTFIVWSLLGLTASGITCQRRRKSRG